MHIYEKMTGHLSFFLRIFPHDFMGLVWYICMSEITHRSDQGCAWCPFVLFFKGHTAANLLNPTEQLGVAGMCCSAEFCVRRGFFEGLRKVLLLQYPG